MIRGGIFACIVVGVIVAAVPAFAFSCTNPLGTEGDQFYNTTYHVMQFCNGTGWINMGVSVNGGIGSLTPGDFCTTDGVNVICNNTSGDLLPVANGGTGVSTAQGNGSKVQLSTGTTTTNDCVKFDANGNAVDTGSACGSVGGLSSLASTNIWVGSASSVATAQALSGDCTLSNAGAITCTKTSGTAFGTLATASTPLSVANGGTGASTLASLISLTADVTGTLPVANGGTGLSAGTSGGVLYYSGSGTLASSGALTQYEVVLGGGAGAAPVVVSGTGTSGQVLTSNGSSSAPTWQASGGSLPSLASGDIWIGSASSVATATALPLSVTNGGTGLSTTTANDLLYSSSTGTIANLATANSSILVTSGGGLPSLSTTLPAHTVTTSVTVPTVYGGSSASSTLTLDGTSNGSPSNAYVLLNPSGQGNVGIGVTSPAANLEVDGAAALNGLQVKVRNTGATAGKYWAFGADGNNNFPFYNENSVGVYVADGGTSWNAASDVRLKKNIKTLTVLDRLNDYRAVSFDWKFNDHHDIGVIAQELYKVFPEIVIKGSDEGTVTTMADKGAWGVSYDKLGALALEGVKELKHYLDGFRTDTEARLHKLETDNDDLRREVAELRREVQARHP